MRTKIFLSCLHGLQLHTFLLAFVCSCTLHAQPGSPKQNSAATRIVKVDDFELNGKGDAAPWSNTTWLEIPQRKGSDPKYSTRLKLLYSTMGIYCLFECDDDKITASLKEDFADLYREDVVEIFFWPDESLPVYFEYELSPLNYELAIMVPNIDGNFFGWKPWHYEGERLTRHATSVNDETTTWLAEIFIPFALLRPLIIEPPKPGDRWRANFYRIDYDNEKDRATWTWNPVLTNFHDYKNFGAIEFAGKP